MNGREIDFDFAAIAAGAMTVVILLAAGLAWVARRLRGMKARKLEESK